MKITGIGPVTPAGIGAKALLNGIMEPVSRTRAVKRFDEAAGAFVAAEVDGFDWPRFQPDPSLRKLARHTQFGVAGAILAAADAGLTFEQMRGMGALVMMGASLIDCDTAYRSWMTVAKKGPRYANPRIFHQSSVLAIATSIARLIGDDSRAMTIQAACCSGIDSVGHAAERVATGEADIALCGGTEAPIFYHPMLELKAAGLAPGNPEWPERQGRPFDLWRTTGVIGEGACVLILEPESSPRPGYAWLSGYGYSSAHGDDKAEGGEDAIEFALANAGLRPTDVDAINAWGPGHGQVDAAEARSLRNVLGRHLDQVPVCSIKGAIGNPLAAAGPIQLAVAAMGMRAEMQPPTVNWQYPDPACRLNLASSARAISSRCTLINARGLLGTNSCVILERC